MKKIIVTFFLGVLKEKFTQTISTSTIGFLSEYKKKITACFVFLQFSVIFLSIAMFHLINEATTSIINETFPTPAFFVNLGINTIIILADVLVVVSIRNSYKDYIEKSSILPIKTNFFSPLTQQLKLERSRYEMSH